MFKSIKVCFKAKYNPRMDRLYTYKIEADAEIEEGQILWVIDREGQPKRVRLIRIDKEYDVKTEERFGELAEAYTEEPKNDTKTAPSRTR